MQHSSLVLFCDECGLANDPAASRFSSLLADNQLNIVWANSSIIITPIGCILAAVAGKRLYLTLTGVYFLHANGIVIVECKQLTERQAQEPDVVKIGRAHV